MAKISEIQGAVDPRLTGQTLNDNRPQPAEPKQPAQKIQASSTEIRKFHEQEVREMAELVQKELQKLDLDHQVGVRQGPDNSFIIEVRNREGEVVRQFPPENLLNLARKLDDLSGMVIDELT